MLYNKLSAENEKLKIFINFAFQMAEMRLLTRTAYACPSSFHFAIFVPHSHVMKSFSFVNNNQ
jgi:hypothetical protein